MLTQHLRDGKYQVGGGNAFRQFAGKLKAHHIRDQHRYRLAKHGRFGFNSANAPAQNAQAVNHGGMRIGAHQSIRIGHPLFILQFTPDRFAQVFKIHLVADTRTGRNDAKAAKGLLPPLQKDVTFVVTLHFQTYVFAKGIVVTKVVHGDRVVDNEINGRERIYFSGIAKALHRFAHCRKVNHSRDPGKVLHQNPCRSIGNFSVSMGMLKPPCQRLDIFKGDGITILPA